MTQLNSLRCLEIIESIATEAFPIIMDSDFNLTTSTDFRFKLTEFSVGSEIIGLDRQDQATLVVHMLDWCGKQDHRQKYPESLPPGGGWCMGFDGVAAAMLFLMNRQLPFGYEDIMALLVAFASEEMYWLRSGDAQLTQTLETYLQEHPLTPELEAQILAVVARLQPYAGSEHKYARRLRMLIKQKANSLAIIPGEAWSDAAIDEINALPSATQSIWNSLVIDCSTVSGSKPSAKWLKSALALVTQLGWDSFTQALLRWLPRVDQPRTQPPESYLASHLHAELLLNDTNVDILRGLVWLCAQQENADIARELGKLALSAYRKLPGIGPRCVRLGNACVWALGQMPGDSGIVQLALLKIKVKFGSAQRGIETALTTAAERLEIPRSEIEELSVPTYGLDAVGLGQEILGDYAVELVITGTRSTELRWFKSDGQPQKSIPKAIKDNFGEDLKALKQAAKDIQTMLPAQCDRIESGYLQQKNWDFATWQTRYLNHPLIGTLARRLIWQFSAGDRIAEGIWLDGQLVNRQDQPLDWLTDTTQIQLWHPITATAETILTWRNWLITHQVRQPFKQAHREIYLLTAAEERTNLYSNRFAAHIIKQHQFNALCGQRGWKNSLRLMVDDCYRPARLYLPQWALRAEFWIEGMGEEYGIDTNAAGSFLYLSTDQVRFYPFEAVENFAQAGEGDYSSGGQNPQDPMPLANIPALVFSEVMRDVDLFVGVASVGNDPNWVDGGSTTPHHDYWQSYSFGDLTETAKTRQQVLETLIPRLKISDRCHFQDKFLVVRGNVRTYKIHLGSGNILMEPNDQYLCIVPDQGSGNSGGNSVFLPFEGDRILSIILSKAFLLAADTEIKDPSILAQINYQ